MSETHNVAFEPSRILSCLFMHKVTHLFNKYLLRNYCGPGSENVQQWRQAWPLPFWSSSLSLSCRSCEERTKKKKIYDFLSFIIRDVLLNKYLIRVQKQMICFFRVHLAELVLKVKSQLLLCQVFLIRKCLIFILCVVHVALIFGI